MDIEELNEELEKYRPYFEEFAKDFGEQITTILGYSEEINVCINIAWIMGFTSGKTYGANALMEELDSIVQDMFTEHEDD